MKTFIFGLIAVSIGVAVVLLASPNSRISRWENSSFLVWDRSEGFSAPRVLTAVDVRLAELPAIASAMSQSSADVAYATLAFCPLDCQTDDDTLNVQLSIENGRPGLDWVLLGPRNIRDEEKFIVFAKSQGFAPVRKKLNGVTYLRVDTDEAADLAARIVTELYQLPPNETHSLYHEGFDWPQT